MKRLAFTVILICLTSLILAQAPLLWNESKSIRQGTNIEWYRTATVFNNNVVYVWSDTKAGGRDLYAQMVDSDGNFPWGPDPLLIDNKADRQEDPVVIVTSDNCLIFAWVDFSLDQAGDIFAQKVNASGQRLWQAGGVPLCTSIKVQIAINIVPDANGGAYVIWSDSRNPSKDIYGQHVNGDGSLAWAVNGIQFGDSDGEELGNTFWEDGQGNAVLAYVYKNPTTSEINLKVLKVTPNGTFAWGPQFLCNAASDQGSVKMAPDGNGGFFFTWEDKRNENDADIYAQHIDTNGTLTWANDLIIYSGAYIQTNPRIVATTGNTAVIVWEDSRLDSAHDTADLLAQKINLQGQKLWANDGVIVSQEDDSQKDPRLSSDDNGGCFVVWDDARSGGNALMDVYAQHISSTGTMTWEANGKVICNLPGIQISSLIKKNSNRCFVVWADQRDGSVGLYNQILDTNGQTYLPQNGKKIFWGLSGNVVDLQSVKSGNNVFAVWEDTRGAGFGYQIYTQKLNEFGDTLFAANGIPITDPNGKDQINVKAIADGEGGFVAAWQENPLGKFIVLAQRIDSNGNKMWGNNGIILVDDANAFEQLAPQISKIGNDFYFFWADGEIVNYTYRILGQKISNGQLQWGPNGKSIIDNAQDNFIKAISEDYIAWEQYNWMTNTGFDIHVLRFTTDGNPATGWPALGLQITNNPENQTIPQILVTPQGAMITYQDNRNANRDLYAQLISPQGQMILQANGYPLVTLPNDQDEEQIYWDGSFKMVWSDYRDGIAKDIAMNKWNLQGNTLVPEWGASGILVVQQDSTQQNPAFGKFNDKMFVCWEDVYAGDSNIKGKAVDEQGIIFDNNEPTGLTISADLKKQEKPLISGIDNNRAFILWTDGRSSGKEEILGAYVQAIDVSLGNDDEIAQVNKNTLSAFNYPNPFNPSTTIKFNVPETQKVTIDIYNIKGQKVTSLWNQVTEKGVHTVNWNGTDSKNKSVGSGMYLYKLSCGKGSITRKVILMK